MAGHDLPKRPVTVGRNTHSGQVEDTQLFVANHPEARLFCSEAGVDPASQIELRLIRVELANGESEVLLTSLLDREAFPAEVFAELYHRRWASKPTSVASNKP